ncbi:hsp70 nucleotide exchange factor fes1 [Orobanche gracilis]
MPSSDAVVPPPPSKPLNADTDDEEIEYEEIEEEIEAEEEIEVEEDIEEEEEEVGEDGEDEIGEDLTPLREQNHEIYMDLEEDEERIQSGPVTRGRSPSTPLTQKDVGRVKTYESSAKDELHISGERTSRDDGPKAPCYSSEEVNDAAEDPVVGDLDAALIMPDASTKKDIIILSVTGETNHTAIDALAKTRQMSPGLHVPQIRFREPSSSAECDRENKKLKIICEFHAKGWCIKGSSCRFLHIKDGLDVVDKKSEVLERQASSSACALPQQSGENSKLNYETEKLLLGKDDTLGTTYLDDGSFDLDNYLTKCSFSEKNSTYNRNYSSCPVTLHGNHHNTRISAFGTTLEDIVSKKNEIGGSAPRSADLPYSYSRQPLSFGSSSWNNDAFGTHNFLKGGSLPRNTSPAPWSESESFLRNHLLTGMKPDKSKTNLPFDNWEPSVPFSPSHAITRNLLLKKNLYDPIRDSIVQTDVKDVRVKFSYSDQGSSVKNANVQSNSSQEEEEKKKLLDSVLVGDKLKDKILSSACDTKLKFDERRHKTFVKVDVSDKNEETDVDFKRDGHVQNESKALKIFHSELVEFVKELVRPTWHEGLLSRDAHKVIVKKAVDKVLGTMQQNQIPSTCESSKLYLSSSRTKLAKLVEAYIDKYGKS